VARRRPEDPAVWRALGDLYSKVGRLDDGLSVDERLIRLTPEEPLAWYNLACSQALCSRPDEALCSLEQAMHLGYDDAAWAGRDPDLKSLAQHPQFPALLERMKAAGRNRANS
jgi:Flp pilus assembly protein TadD